METFFPRDLIASENFRLVWTLFQFSDKVHARRDYTDAVKAASLDHKDNPEAAKNTIAYQALKRIGTIYDLEGTLKDLSPEERLIARQTTIKPLVDEYFTWVKETLATMLPKGKTADGLNYSVNQEKYL